jgi:hypothetical protein
MVVRRRRLFIKRISVVQHYAGFLGFTFPVHVHVNAVTRVIGRAVDIYHLDYRSVSGDANSAEKKDEVPDRTPLNRGTQLSPQLLLYSMVQ